MNGDADRIVLFVNRTLVATALTTNKKWLEHFRIPAIDRFLAVASSAPSGTRTPDPLIKSQLL